MKKLVLLLMLGISVQVQAQVAQAQNSSSGKEEALEAIGGSAGLLLYNTYLVIGASSDAYVGEVYTGATVTELVNEQLGGVKTIKEQYHALMGTKFLSDPADVKFMKDILVAFDLIVEEGQALLAYIDSGNQQEADAYETKRLAAWAKISALLGLED